MLDFKFAIKKKVKVQIMIQCWKYIIWLFSNIHDPSFWCLSKSGLNIAWYPCVLVRRKRLHTSSVECLMLIYLHWNVYRKAFNIV